jgi:two-component sensor histidine kinase
MTFRYLLTCICAISFSANAFSADQIDSLNKVLDQPIPKVERALTLIKLAELSEDEVSESHLQEAELFASSLPEEQSILVINDLITAYNLDKHITNRVSIEVKELDIDVLIPLGLITNEIIANSLKYAFKETDSGEITVSVKESDGLVEVVLGDNGSGFDFEKYYDQKETLGIELITTLVEQFDGELSYSKEDGSFYTIKFAV